MEEKIKATMEKSEEGVKATGEGTVTVPQEEAKQLRDTRVSYDQLNNIAMQLSEHNRKLVQQLNDRDYSIQIKRVDWLLSIIGMSDKFSPEFITRCVEEIEQQFTIDETDNTEEPTKE
jgi:hypothetical protein